MPRKSIAYQSVAIRMDLISTASLLKLVSIGLFQSLLDADELSRLLRVRAVLADELRHSGYYTPSELEMVLDSACKTPEVAL